MPNFTQIPRPVVESVSQKMIDQYASFIEESRGNVGVIEFEPGENVKLNRKALRQAAQVLGVRIRISKVDPTENGCDVLNFVELGKIINSKPDAKKRKAD